MNKQQEKIELQERVLRVKKRLIKLRVYDYPRNDLQAYTPFKSIKKYAEWDTLASNVWHLRSTDESITIILENLVTELEKDGSRKVN